MSRLLTRKGKRNDVFAPASAPITSRIIDAKIVEYEQVAVTFDVEAAYPLLDEPDDVIMIPPPEWRKAS